MENLDKIKEKPDSPATMEEIRLKRLAYFQNLQPNSSSDTKELTVSCGAKPNEASDILPSFSRVKQTEQKTKLNTMQTFHGKEDMHETRNSKSDSHITGLKKSSSPDKIAHVTVKQTYTESDRRGSLAGSPEDSFDDDVNPGVLSKISKPSESDGLPQFSVHRSVNATKLSATKWMSSEDVRHEQCNKHSQSIRNSGENKIESLFSSRRWTSACEVNTSSLKDSVEVDKVSAFSSTVDFDDLGLSTHRPGSNVNAENVQLQKQSVSLENLFSGQKAEELRDLLGEQKYREFVKKSERDLNMLHCQQSQESPLLSSGYSGERKEERASKKPIITPRNVPTPPGTQTYSNLKQSSSPCRRLRSNSPKMVSKMLQDIPQNNHAKETAMSKNYEQVVVPHNVTFSADEIYRQAYGSSENSAGGGDSGENELKRSVESWGLSHLDGMTSFWDNLMPQQVAGAYSPASRFSSSLFHRPFVPVAGDQPRYSYLPMNPNLNQVRPFVFSQGAAGMQGIPSPGQNMYPVPTTVLATMSPAGIFSPGMYQHLGNPPLLNMQSLYSPVGQSEDSVQNSVGAWQHLGQTPAGTWQHFGQKEPAWAAKERQSSSDSCLRESIKVMAPHPPVNAPSKVHSQAGGEPSFTAYHTARHIEAVRQHHQQKHESKEVAATQKGAAARSENLLERYFSSLEHTPPSQQSSPHLTHHDYQREEVETAEAENEPNEKNETLERTHFSIGLPKDKDDDSLTTATRTSLTMGTSIKAEGITPRMEELGVDPLVLCQLKTQTLSADQEMLKSLKQMVRVCPDCSFVNKEYMTWCLQCGAVLIGVDPVPAISLRKKRKPKKASSAKSNRPVSNQKPSDKTADHEGKMFQIVDKKRMVEENKTRKDKETCLDILFTEENEHPFENQVAENSKHVDSKESSESGNGTSALSSPDNEVTSRKSNEEREGQQNSLQEEAVAEKKDSGRPSSGEGRGTDEGISHPASEHPERTEKEINEICEVISDPIIRGFIKSYFKKQALQDGRTEKINSGQNMPSKGENTDEKEHVSRCCNTMSDSLNLDLGLSLSSTAEGTKASKKVQEANKIQKSQRRSNKNGDEAIDVEIFAIEEARLSKSARCGVNVVPALNLGCSSDEEDVLDEKISEAPNCPGTIDQKTSRSEDDADQLKTVNYSAEVKALLTVDPVPVDQPDQAQENRTGSGSIPRHFANREGHLVKSDHNRNTNGQQPLSKNARPSSASKIRSSNEAVSQSRRWARSSVAWSSYHPRELRTWSSTNIHQGSHGPGKWHKAGNARGSFSAGDLSSNVRSATHWPSQKTRPSSADQNPRTAQGRQSSSAGGSGSNGGHFGFPVQSLQHSKQQRGVGDPNPRGADSQHSSNSSGTALSPRFPETIEHRLPIQGNTLPLIPAGPTAALQIYDRCTELTPRTHDHNMSKWLLLPDEMWLHVFSYLPQKDLAKAACVCKQLYRVAMDETLWKHLTVKKSDLCDEWLAQIAYRHPVSLALVHCHGNKVSSEGLRDLFREVAPYLQELNFSRCSKGLLTGDNILLHASTKCRSLTHVDASWCHVTDSGLSALAECSHRLESLCLNGCQMITDKGLESVVTKHGQSLRVLELFGCFGLTEPGFLSLGTHCGSLLTLNIGQCHKVTDSCMTILSASLGNLESLDLRGCKHIKDSCIRKIVRNCPRLKVLTLANCPSISDAAIKEIATYSADIRVLDVCGCQKVTDVSTRTLANNCTRLMELDISSTGCTDKSVLLLADLCRWLERAKLSFLPDITDHCIHKLIKNCTRLKTIHLFGCNKVNVAKLRTLNRFIKIEN